MLRFSRILSVVDDLSQLKNGRWAGGTTKIFALKYGMLKPNDYCGKYIRSQHISRLAQTHADQRAAELYEMWSVMLIESKNICQKTREPTTRT